MCASCAYVLQTVLSIACALGQWLIPCTFAALSLLEAVVSAVTALAARSLLTSNASGIPHGYARASACDVAAVLVL